MRTVSQVVEEVIVRSPFLAEALAEGIANNAEIARRIKPDIERRLLEEVSESSIAMALHRMSKKPKHLRFGLKFLKNISDITVRSGLVELAFPSTIDLLPALRALSRETKEKKEEFVNVSRGVRESLCIVNKEFEKAVLDAFPTGSRVRRSAKLSALTLP